MPYIHSIKENPSIFLRGYRACHGVRRKINAWVVSITDNWIGLAYENRWPWRQSFLFTSLMRIRCLSAQWLKEFEAVVYTASGIKRATVEPFSLLFIGSKKPFQYLCHELFEASTLKTYKLGRCPFWSTNHVAQDIGQAYDLVVAERSITDNWVPHSGEWVRSPHWVRMVVDLAPNINESGLWALYHRGQRRWIQKLIQNGYTIEQSSSREDFWYFYNHMYVPTMQVRHSEYSGYGDSQYFEKLIKTGILQFICSPEGKRVGGQVSLPRFPVMYGVVIGVLEGDEKWHKEGVMVGLYHYALKYAIEQHFQRFDAGEVMPMITNGLYLFKQRLGLHPVSSPWHQFDWLFWAPTGSPIALEWLTSNPFIPQFAFSGGEKLGAWYGMLEKKDAATPCPEYSASSQSAT